MAASRSDYHLDVQSSIYSVKYMRASRLRLEIGDGILWTCILLGTLGCMTGCSEEHETHVSSEPLTSEEWRDLYNERAYDYAVDLDHYRLNPPEQCDSFDATYETGEVFACDGVDMGEQCVSVTGSNDCSCRVLCECLDRELMLSTYVTDQPVFEFVQSKSETVWMCRFLQCTSGEGPCGASSFPFDF